MNKPPWRLGHAPGRALPSGCWRRPPLPVQLRAARWPRNRNPVVGGGLPPRPPPPRVRSDLNDGDGDDEGGSGGAGDSMPLAALAELSSKLHRLRLAFAQAVQALWGAQRAWLRHSLARLVLALALAGTAATAAANWWGVRALNEQVLLQAEAAVAALLQRDLQLGAVRWVSPLAGALGLGPLACLGPVTLGPGPVERSSAEVQRVWVGLDLVQSALQRRVVLAVKARGAQVDLVQASNFSWFGYPEDTEPSARNFVPGAGGSDGTNIGGGSDGSAGGSGAAGGSSSTASTGASPDAGASPAGTSVPRAAGSLSTSRRRSRGRAAYGSGAAPAARGAQPTAHHALELPPAGSASSSAQLQALVESITRAVLAQGAQQLAAARGQQGLSEEASGSAGPGTAAGEGHSQAQAPGQAQGQQQQQQQEQQQQRQEQPGVVILSVGGAGAHRPPQRPQPLMLASCQLQGGASSTGSGSIDGSSHGTGSIMHWQQSNVGQAQGQAVARAVGGGGSGGSASSIFGGKISWGKSQPAQGPAAQEPPPQSQQPSGQPSRRQQQLAALNALRLQAGRGYSLRASSSSGAAASSVDTQATASPSAAALPSGSVQQHDAPEQFEPAGHRSCTPPRVNEQQDEPQHRKLHRRRTSPEQRQRRGAAVPKPEPSQTQALQAGPAVADPRSAAAAGASLPAPAARRAPRGSITEPRAPNALPGTAASLNKQLRSLAARRTSKMFSASAAEGAAGEQAAMGAVEDGQDAAMPGGAAAAGLVPKAPAMSAEQRRAALAAINSLPTIVVEGGRRPGRLQALQDSGASTAPAPTSGEGLAARVPPADSPATRRINALGPVQAPHGLRPTARVSGAAQGGGFAALVVDPATLHKKGGSASLPWAHQRPPATSLIGARLGLGKRADGERSVRSSGAALEVGADEGVARAAEGAVLAAGGDGSFQLDSAHSSGGAASLGGGTASSSAGISASTAGEAPSATLAQRRPPLMHPGYFSPFAGPSYTPAPPEALIDARNRRTTLATLLRGAWQVAVSRLHVPEVALGEVALTGATLDAHVHGEALPRRFRDVRARVRLGSGYDTLHVELSAQPYERHPSSAKCTMPSPHAHRHLRHVTGAAAVRAYQQHEAAAASGDARAAALAAAAAEGRDLPWPVVAHEEAPSAPATAADAYGGTPSGGRVEVYVDARHITSGEVPGLGQQPQPGAPVPSLDIRVRGSNLHAPLIERLVELPMDIAAGRANGELRIHSHDAASWHFPEFYGRVAVKDAAFHFWDATDDITGACLELLFERDRLYLHHTSGRFGAVAMTLTGDLDLNPEVGQYRLSATVPGVEVNALRATLGVRPTPQPVAGAVAGVLHVTGPLEKPVFSGTARGVRPTPAQLAECEPSAAVAVLESEPRAVGAYDRMPLAGAGAVFALDTATETMQLHALHGELLDGGQLRGSGRMWVAPRAEMDPSAVTVSAEGHDVAVEPLARRYLPDGVALPPGMVLGRASLSATMQGSHMEPTLEVAVSLPEAQASCSATLRREAARLTLASPQAEAAATFHLSPPGFDAIKAAVTQAAAIALAQPNVTGLDADVSLKGLDVVPLVSDEAALRQLAVQQSGQPVRLRLNGRVRVAGTVTQQPAGGGAGTGREFSGDFGLESVRVNQLKLFQKLAGRLAVSDSGVSVHGKGTRASETLDLDLALPLLAPSVPAPRAPSADVQPRQLEGAQAAGAGDSLRDAPAAQGAPAGAAEPPASAAAAAAAAEAAADVPAAVGPAQAEQAAPEVQKAGGGRLQLRCGPLLVASDINAAGSQLNFKVAALKLDELELASLRGDLQEISCSLNFDSHTGRGKLALANPRYSGLRGDSLSGGFRWERDVVRLEKLLLVQQRSRYEVQGEYSLPPNTPLPSSAADLALQPVQSGPTSAVPAGGRWRVQVSVPAAELQEIVPVARLLQSATSLSPSQYERAKASFLHAIERASIRAAELNSQLRSMAEQLAPLPASEGAGRRADAAPAPGSALHLPGLQDVRGQWGGSIQAYGGGSSATSCDFDVKGQAWQWGAYGLDALVAAGSYHSEEGVQLQEFVLKSGDAKLLVRGSLLGEHQDASVLLTDFSISTLRPLFRAIPALQHAVPAVPAERPPPVAAPRPLGMLTNTLGRVATKGLRGEDGDADSPINGLLYVSGNITGSRTQPTGELAVRLYDAAVGQTRLQQAQASARLTEHQLLNFNVEVVPAEGHRQSGYIKARGFLPLPEAAGSGASSSGAGTSALASGPGPASGGMAAAQQQQQLDVQLSVKDGGMALLTSITPDLRWLSGQASVDVRLAGSLERPVLSGSASISKATLECPALLRWPLTNVAAEVRARGGMLTVEALEARCGRRGTLRMRGSLPVYASHAAQQQPQHRLVAEASGLELRLRNLYSGQYDAALVISSSLSTPTVAGSMRFSKGTVFILPQGAPDVASAAASAGSDTLLTPSATGASNNGVNVARMFEILTRGESGLAQQFEAVMKQEVEAVEAMVEDAGQHNVALDGLAICLGPDLRASYPLVMNFGVEGELTVSGPAHPDQVRVRGAVRLPSGDVNLVATQLALDRDHANVITFHPDQSPGLDPLVDLVMTGGDLRVAIQGKASEWQDHLTLHYISNKARPDSGEALDPADAARLFEEKLKQALLAEDGQLALSRLAGTTVSTLMPKLETQGQVGGARWRLVSAPSIPGLLSLDPSLADPSNILSSISMGTEVEVQFGSKLQLAMIRKLQESDVTTQWSLMYKLNNKLRMQFNLTSAPPFPRTLMFQFSSEGAGSA